MALNFDYAKAIGQAKQIEASADELKQVGNNELTKMLNDLPGIWAGEASTLYAQNLEKLKSEIQDEAKKLYDIAGNIRKTAKIILEAEEQAKKTVIKLGGGGGR